MHVGYFILLALSGYSLIFIVLKLTYHFQILGFKCIQVLEDGQASTRAEVAKTLAGILLRSI